MATHYFNLFTISADLDVTFDKMTNLLFQSLSEENNTIKLGKSSLGRKK